MFLTSAAHLLNRTGKWVWIPAGIRPLRRHAPVSGINKSADGEKNHTTGSMKGCYRDEKGL